MDPAEFYAGVALDEVRKACPPAPDGRIAEDAKLVFSVQLFLVQKPGQNVLIDMGTGNDKERPGEPYWTRQNHAGRELARDRTRIPMCGGCPRSSRRAPGLAFRSY